MRSEKAHPPSDWCTDPVERLVAQCLERMDREGTAALDSICGQHTEHATAVRREIERLQRMGLVGVPAAGEPAFPEQLGEFRLIRRLGGGGMGVVYLAEQPELARRVAIKLVRPDHLYFGGARDRFRREIEAVARLQHPGIVPIYSIGEERGIPYFVMEWVRGCSVADVLKQLEHTPPERLAGSDLMRVVRAQLGSDAEPAAEASFGESWVEACFRVVSAVAEALEHAHARGVLHRDLKPSNIMVTGTGRVLLLDFGLARVEGTSRLTQTGLLLGSLPYVSPEQVDGDGDGLDVRSDLYSLGVTLYEMLALQSPYHGASLELTRSRILEGRPRSIRALNPAVPWDVETVCLTAMERLPERRYASAAAFGRDLRNVLELRPIEAKRPGPWLLARRWAQRHPAWSAALSLGLCLVVGGSIGFGVYAQRKNLRIAHERDLADAMRLRAEDHLKIARRAVLDLLVDVGSRQLRNVPQMDRVREQMVERAVGFYERFLIDAPDPAVRAEMGHDLYELAKILTTVGKMQQAKTFFAKALGFLRDSAGPENPHGQVELGACYGDLASAHLSLSELPEAERNLRLAMAIHRDLCDRFPDRDEYRVNLARVLDSLGHIRLLSGEAAEALGFLRQAHGLMEGLSGRTVDVNALNDHGTICATLGTTLYELNLPDEAEEMFREADGLFEQVEKLSPIDGERRVRRAVNAQSLALLLVGTDRAGEALDFAESAVAMLEKLAADFPDRIPVQRELASSKATLAAALAQDGKEDAARTTYRDAIELIESVARRSPENPDHWQLLAEMHGELGDLLAARDDRAEAESQYRAAIQAMAAATAGARAPMTYLSANRARRAQTLLGLARILCQRHEYADARTLARQDLGEMQAALASSPAEPLFRRAVADAETVLAECALALGD